MKNQSQTVIFIHIPKTAGSTLNWCIYRQFAPETVQTFRWPFHYVYLPTEEFKQIPEAQRQKIKVITGHLDFGLHKVIRQPSTYITVLREPVSRIISAYYHTRRDHHHPIHCEVSDLTIDDYIRSGLALDVNNGQTRRLSGIGGQEPYGVGSRDMLEQAKQNIRSQFTVVGLTERFEETLLLLKQKLGWSPYYLTQNRGRNRPVKPITSSNTLDLIREYNQLDIELYDYAQTLFTKQIRQYGASFEQELQHFKFVNNYLFKLYILPHRTLAKIKWEFKKRFTRKRSFQTKPNFISLTPPTHENITDRSKTAAPWR